MRSTVALVLSAAATCICCHAQQSPVISGFVTTPGSTTYQVNGVSVRCDPATTTERVVQHGQTLQLRQCADHTLGLSITVYGSHDKKAGIITATAVETDTPIDLAVDGYALIDRVLAPIAKGTGVLRADGYRLSLTPATVVTFAPSSGLTLASIGTDVWVRYRGTLHTDGTVSAESMLFSPNLIKPREDKLRGKTDFDAAAVREEDRQGTASRLLLGRKAKQIPASQNEDAQRRIDTVGRRLVPAYQQQLPELAPTKINFRFQLVDDAKLRTTLSEPSGVIQVPESIPATLADDSQLAAILSAAVAEVLEKQILRAIPANTTRTAAVFAGTAAGAFVPGVGIATQLIAGKNASIAEHHREEQSTRTGLAFMQDGGFDVAQAPIAWWTLAASKGKPLANTRLPYPTQYLYSVLNTAYRTAPAEVH